MPTSSRTTKKTAAPRKRRAAVVAMPAVDPIQSVPNVCRSCHSLPAGSMELMSLMLVLVFSLTAVLFTAVYALNIQGAKLQAYEAQAASQSYYSE